MKVFLFIKTIDLLMASLLKDKLKDFSSPILKDSSWWVLGNFVQDPIKNKIGQKLKRVTKNSGYFLTALKR